MTPDEIRNYVPADPCDIDMDIEYCEVHGEWDSDLNDKCPECKEAEEEELNFDEAEK